MLAKQRFLIRQMAGQISSWRLIKKGAHGVSDAELEKRFIVEISAVCR